MNNLVKLVSLVLLCASATAYGQSQWHLRYPQLNPSGLLGVTYGAGQYVAVGFLRTVFTSPDGVHWESRLSDREGALYAVAYGNDRFVATGTRNNNLNIPDEGGTIMTSRDGRAWVEELNPDNYFLSRLVFSHDLFVGSGRRLGSDGVSRPVIVTSPEGSNWTERWRPNDMDVWRPELIAGNGTIVVALPTGDFVVSTNALDWISVAPGWAPVSNPVLAFGAGKFIATAQVWDGQSERLQAMVSTDGLVWTRKTIREDWTNTFLFGAVGREQDSVILAVRWIPTAQGETSSESFGLTTTNGDDWTEHPLTGVLLAQTGGGAPDEITKGGQLIYAGGQFVMVGQPQTGLVIANQLTRIFTSGDGIQWTRRNDGEAYLLHVAAGEQEVVAIGGSPQGTIVLKSKTGVDWTEAPPLRDVRWLNSIAYGNGTYVAAGDPGIFHSSDALTWHPQDSAGSKWDRVRHMEGTFLAFGNEPVPNGQRRSKLGTSTNGLDWRMHQITQFTDVVHVASDGKFLFAIAESYDVVEARNLTSIWRSSDGEDWTKVYRSSKLNPQCLAFGNGIYVAAASYTWPGTERVLLSADGVQWTAHDGLPEPGNITFARGKFYATGSLNNEVVIFSSSDGRKWSAESTGSLRGLTELTTGPQGLFATALGSAILHAPWDLTLSQPRRSSQGHLTFDINGNSGQQVLIESASSLAPAAWKPLSTNKFAGPSLRIIDAEAGEVPQRFYRASAR